MTSNDNTTFEQVTQAYKIKFSTCYTCVAILSLVLLVYFYVGAKVIKKFANSNLFFTLIFLTFLVAVLFKTIQSYFLVYPDRNYPDYYQAI